MEKTVKILLIVCIILVACFSVSVGYILQGNLLTNTQPEVSAINQSNNITNQTANNKTNSSQKTNYIGKAAAKSIAIDYLTEYGSIDTTEIRSIDFVTINGVSLYRVKTYDHYITYDGTEAGWEDIFIGAKDGKIYDDSGELITT